MPLDLTIPAPPVSRRLDVGESPEFDPALATRQYGFREAETLKTKEQQLTELLTVAPVSAAVGGVDTIIQSVGLADESTVPKLLEGTAVGNYYMENRDAAQLAGDVIFGFGIVGGAMKLARSGSILEQSMQKILGGRAPKFLFTSGKSVDDLMIPIAQRDSVILTEQLGKSVLDDDVAKAAVRTAKWTRLMDNVKETMWADAAVLGLQSSALPDDMSATTTAAMFVIPDAIFAGANLAGTRAAITKMRVKLGEQFAAAQNPRGFAVTDIPITAPAMLDASFTMRANFAADLRTEMRNKLDDPAFMQNAETTLRVFENEMFNPKNGIAVMLGATNPHPGVTGKFAVESPHINTAKATTENDPNVYMDVLSFERWDEGFHGQHIAAKEKQLDALKVKAVELELTKSSLVGPPTPELMKQLDQVHASINELKSIHTFVNEIDGTLSPTSQRRFTVYDDVETTVKKHAGRTTDEGARLSITFRDSDGNAKTIGMTNSGMLIMPEAPKVELGTFIGGVNVSKAGLSVPEAMQEAKYLLKDIGEDWHFANGKRGKSVFEQLDPEIQSVLKDWTGTSRGSKLRRWEEIGDPRFNQIVDAYRQAGLHARLAEVANPDGTITLFRGETRQETKHPTNNVVSMSSNPKKAAQFGEHLTSRRVPVDDVVMVIGGLGDEWEFIVKNHKSRNFDQSVAPITKTVFQPLGLEGHMATYKVAREYFHSVFPKSSNKFMVYPGMHHTQLDLAADLIEAGHGSRVAFAGKTPFKSVDDIQYAALMQKFDEIQNMWNLQKVGKEGILKLPAKQQYSDIDIARMFNLPSNGNLPMNPLLQLMREVYVPGKVVDMRTFFRNMDDVRNGVKIVAGADPSETFNAGFKFRGSLISAPKDRQPFVAMYKNEPPPLVTPEMVNQRAIAYKQAQMQKWLQAGNMGADIVNTTFTEMMRHPQLWAVASRVDLVFAGQASGRGIANFKNAAVRQMPVMQAADQLIDISGKAGRKYATETILKPVFPIYQKIQSLNHMADAQLYDVARNARRQGWQVLDEPVQDPISKLWMLQLNPDEAINKTLWKQHFGEEMPDGAFMPALVQGDPSKKAKPLAMTELAFQALQAEDYLSRKMLDNMNFLRYLTGKSPIKRKPWHVFSANLDAGANVYLFDEKTMQLKHIVAGDSVELAERHAQKVIKESLGTDSPLMMKYAESMEEYFDMQAKVWERPENYSITYLQTGQQARGKSVTPIVETGPRVIQTMLESVIRQTDNIVRMTHSVAFDTELQFARHQKAAAVVKSDKRAALDVNKATRETEWDQYESIIMQKTGINRETPLGNAYGAIEHIYEYGLNFLERRMRPVSEPVMHAYNDVVGKYRYEALERAVGEYNPFTSILDYGKRTYNLTAPSSMRNQMAAINRLSIDLSLRIADLGMPLINTLGLVSVLPAVMKSIVRQGGESVADWNARVGPFASVVDGDVAVPNVFRMLMTVGHDYWNDPNVRRGILDAKRMGLLDQEAAERAALLTAPAQGYVSSLFRKGIDVLSWPTDKSEVFARGVSFAAGYSLGSKLMKLSHEDAILLGHKVANMTVGDYRPSNRPQIFQGAAGIPLGLYTTYMYNFFSRVFRDVEDKRWGAVLKQAVWQHSLFGAESLPGFETVQNVMTESYDGTRNLSDSLDARYGKDFTDWFLMGTVANAPKWFGASDGIAITSRASLAFPLSQVAEQGTLSALPAFNTVKTLGEGLVRIGKSLRDNGGFNSRQIAEILSNHAVNGAVRNSIDWYMGYDVDKRGALINADLDSAIEGVARFFEFKTQREYKLAREYGRSARIQQIRADHIDSLNQKIMTDARAGKINGENPELLNDYMREAARIGMTYPDFKRLLGATVKRGLIDKSSREMAAAFASSHRRREAARYFTIMDDSQAGME